MKIRRLTLKQKLQHQLGGINTSNKAQLKRIEKLKIKEEIPQVPLSTFYIRLNGVWINKGVACRLCDSLLSDPVVIDKHRYICRVLNNKNKSLDE